MKILSLKFPWETENSHNEKMLIKLYIDQSFN